MPSRQNNKANAMSRWIMHENHLPAHAPILATPKPTLASEMGMGVTGFVKPAIPSHVSNEASFACDVGSTHITMHHAGLSGETPHVGRRRDADPFPPHSSMSGVAMADIITAESASIMVACLWTCARLEPVNLAVCMTVAFH